MCCLLSGGVVGGGWTVASYSVSSGDQTDRLFQYNEAADPGNGLRSEGLKRRLQRLEPRVLARWRA